MCTISFHPPLRFRLKELSIDKLVGAQVRIQRGRTGGPHPRPPGKSQVIWVSIGYKQLDPPGTLKNDRFLWNWPFDCCKISWGLKKKKKKKKKTVSELFFVRLTWTPPPLKKIPWSAHGAWCFGCCQAHRGLPIGFILLRYSLSFKVDSLSLLYLLFISWFICSRRWCIDKLGVFHANQISMCLEPHLN